MYLSLKVKKQTNKLLHKDILQKSSSSFFTFSNHLQNRLKRFFFSIGNKLFFNSFGFSMLGLYLNPCQVC